MERGVGRNPKVWRGGGDTPKETRHTLRRRVVIYLFILFDTFAQSDEVPKRKQQQQQQ